MHQMVNKSSFISSFKKLSLFIVIFLIIGEVFIRIDIYLSIKAKNNIIEVKDIKLTAKDSNAKIMVLGDSFIYGGGINSEKKASNELANTKNIPVADLSRPSNNTVDNYNTFMNYIDSINPEMVVLGYHINDITGGVTEDKLSRKGHQSEELPEHNTQVKKNESSLKSLIKKVYRSWKSLEYISSNLQNSLKVNYGLILPGGEQYQISKELYKKDSPDWVLTQKLIEEIQKNCDDHGIKFLILVFTDFNTIGSNAINEFPISTFTKFCISKDIQYIDTRQLFKSYKINDLVISKYDGHPNEMVHRIIADNIYSFYKTNVPN